MLAYPAETLHVARFNQTSGRAMNKDARGRRMPRPTRKSWCVLTAACAAAIGSLSLNVSFAADLDAFGEPPLTDPSRYTEQPADPLAAISGLATQPHPNGGALEIQD